MRALMLYQEALAREPALHAIAIKTLSEALADCSSEQAGATCYWLGLHSEYSSNLREAAAWYERAAKAYGSIGYKKRESRARCNLGSVKMQMRDGSGMEELERATVLDPQNGTAYLNIARTYYSFSYPDDPGYELALDAFANAVRADPETYTPDVISSLRELGYNWSQEWEEIAKRVRSNGTHDT
jgi:tetratricopeptide (TPR) repeat protein